MDSLIILQSDNIENDYRLIKQCRTLEKNSFSPHILYFHIHNSENLNGLLNGKFPYSRKKLITRRLFKSGRLIVLKLLEQWIKSLLYIFETKSKNICVHDDRSIGLIFLLYPLKKLRFIKTISWDLRELPISFLNSKISRLVLKLSFIICDSISSANKERKEVLIKELSLKENISSKIYTICNFPDKSFVDINKKSLPEALRNWLSDSEYIYIQSPTEPQRYFFNSISSLIDIEGLKVVVTGRVSKKSINKLRERYKEILDQKVFFTGLVDPYSLPEYIDQSICSLILYSDISENSRLCAPNRLYQSLSRGVPVVCGNNPPMKNIVSSEKVGVILQGDGKESEHIKSSILEMISDHKLYKLNAERIRYKYIWDTQEQRIMSFFTNNA